MLYRLFGLIVLLIPLVGCSCRNNDPGPRAPTMTSFSPGDIVVLQADGSPRLHKQMQSAFSMHDGDPHRFFMVTRPTPAESSDSWNRWGLGGEVGATEGEAGIVLGAAVPGVQRGRLWANAGRNSAFAWGDYAAKQLEAGFDGDAVLRTLSDEEFQRLYEVVTGGRRVAADYVVSQDASDKYVVSAVLYSNAFLEAHASGGDAGALLKVIKARGFKSVGSTQSFRAKRDSAEIPSPTNLDARGRVDHVINHWRPVLYVLTSIAEMDTTGYASEPHDVSAVPSFIRAWYGEGDQHHRDAMASIQVPAHHMVIVDRIDGEWSYDKFSGVEAALMTAGARVDVSNLVGTFKQFGVIDSSGSIEPTRFREVIRAIWQAEFVDKGHAEEHPIADCRTEAEKFDKRMMDWIDGWLLREFKQITAGPETGEYWLELVPLDFSDVHFGHANRAVWKRYCYLYAARCVFHSEVPSCHSCGYTGYNRPEGTFGRECFPDSVIPTYSLLAHSGGKYHQVQPGWTWRNETPETVPVYFGINDDICGDNEGELQMQVRVVPILGLAAGGP